VAKCKKNTADIFFKLGAIAPMLIQKIAIIPKKFNALPGPVFVAKFKKNTADICFKLGAIVPMSIQKIAIIPKNLTPFLAGSLWQNVKKRSGRLF
jgi:hypothetical protein